MTKNRHITTRERLGVSVTFAIGEPITVPAATNATPEGVSAVTAGLRDTLQQMTDELQTNYPEDGTGQWWQPQHLGGTAPTLAEAAAADDERRRRRAGA